MFYFSALVVKGQNEADVVAASVDGWVGCPGFIRSFQRNSSEIRQAATQKKKKKN